MVSGGVLGPPAERIAATRKRLLEDHANMVLSPAAAADLERRPPEANEGTP